MTIWDLHFRTGVISQDVRDDMNRISIELGVESQTELTYEQTVAIGKRLRRGLGFDAGDRKAQE